MTKITKIKNIIINAYSESNHDGFIFMPNDKNVMQISTFSYESPHSNYKKSNMGFSYHIVLFNKSSPPESFIAILGDPYSYISNLIHIGLFGVIAKSTNKSQQFIDNFIADI